ncbi:MAG: trehalase, partial [Cellvibrio sp.]|nr:trehalase [Cellvibrio sp.]
MKTRFICYAYIALLMLCVGCAHIGNTDSEKPALDKFETASINLASPDKRFGDFFIAVQLSGIFTDSKTFVDAIPLYNDATILENYHNSKSQPDFNLKEFVADNFAVPLDNLAVPLDNLKVPLDNLKVPLNSSTGSASASVMENAPHFVANPSRDAVEHMNLLWGALVRQPTAVIDSGTLVPLPKPYVVPGGRFREIYYWDSYFTMLGLQASGRWDLIENMVDNFSYLIDTLGFIPNGNRTYYLSRSQPPFYSLMVKLLEEGRGKGTLEKYLVQLQKEYDFWMIGASALTPASPASRRVVLLPDGSIMNRYWDKRAAPRPEAYKEDVDLIITHRLSIEKYRDIRAAAESGWDFSSRWFKDQANMA